VIAISFRFHIASIRSPEGLDEFASVSVEHGIVKTNARSEDDDIDIDYAYRFDSEVFTEDEAREWLDNNDIEYSEFIPYVKENSYTSVFRNIDEVSWDDAKAKRGLIAWATDENGRISKKSLMKWFMDIDGGSGQDPNGYRYPVGSINDGVPVYDARGIDHSWDLAMGKKTGVANRAIQRKIVFLKQREKLPLTDEQREFIERHMAAGHGVAIRMYKNDLRSATVLKENSTFYVHTDTDKLLDPANEREAHQIAYEYARTGNLDGTIIKMNVGIREDIDKPGGLDIADDGIDRRNEAIESGSIRFNQAYIDNSKVIEETDDYIEIPVIPMREGVFVGTDGIRTLKDFDAIQQDAHWLEGQPILRGHTAPTEIVTYKHPKIGKLRNVTVRPDSRDVVAVARYYKDKINEDELNRIRSGKQWDGSIAYTTNTIPIKGTFQTRSGDIEPYDAVETDGFYFYHFADLGDQEGACSVERGCGFNLNSTGVTVNIVKHNCGCDDEMTTKPKAKKQENEEPVLVVDDDGNECIESEMVDGKCPKKPAASEVDEVPVLVIDDDGNECLESEMVNGKCPKKPAAAEVDEELEDEEEEKPKANSRMRPVTVRVKIPEEFTTKLNSAMSENRLLKRQLADLSRKVDGLVQKQNEVSAAQVAEREERDFKAFAARLNVASQDEAMTHYEGFKQNGWGYFDDKPNVFSPNVRPQKFNGVGAIPPSIANDRAAARAELKETLRPKKSR